MATELVAETERKYEVTEDFALPELTGTGRVAATGQRSTHELDATYFDTADLRLARASITVRRRTGGTDAGWHAKLPVAGDRRDEVRLPLGTAGEIPPELSGLLRAHTLDRPMTMVTRIVTHRTELELLDADGTVLALLADDRVRTEPAGEHWREVEVEVAPRADPGVLDQLHDVLLGAGARPARFGSKLARALGGPATTTHPAGPDGSAGAVALAYLLDRFTALRGLDAGVRLERPDAVHQFRVTCRRLRSALRSFRRLLDRDTVEDVRAELKWLGGELAPARDTEVLERHLRAELAGTPSENVLGPVAARFTAHYARAAAEARTRYLSAMDSERYLTMLTRLERLLADPPASRAAGRPARRELRRPVRRAWRGLAAAMDAAMAARPGPERDRAMHRARKEAKKARYTAEAVAPAFGAKLDRWRRRVKQAQSALGTHQDAVVARQALRQHGIQAHLAGDTAFTYGLLHEREHHRAEVAERDFARRHDRLLAGGRPSWLSG